MINKLAGCVIGVMLELGLSCILVGDGVEVLVELLCSVTFVEGDGGV